MYTKNLLYEEYPGGPARLENNILGGELFDTILYNYVSELTMCTKWKENPTKLDIYLTSS